MVKKTLKIVLLATFVFNYSCQKENSLEQKIDSSKSETSLVRFENSKKIEGEYIVLFGETQTKNLLKSKSLLRTTSDYNQRQKLVRDFLNSSLRSGTISFQKESLLKVYSAESNYGFAAKLNSNDVKTLKKEGYKVSENVVFGITPICQILPFCSEGGDSSGGENRAQKTPWGITRIGGATNFSNSNKKAWVVDTGIDLDHPDLNVDQVNSKDFTGKGTPDDGQGHGTHVAGTIGAINNNFGVVGVAAGVKVVGIKVLRDNGRGSNSDILAGVDYVAQKAKKGDVVNLSLGGPISGSSFPVEDALIKLASKGVFVILAAGNSSRDANSFTPAKANGTNLYTISSMNNRDDMSWFSNYGNPPIDFVAPGSNVNSTIPGGRYAVLSGTSMAAPHAAGIFLVTNGKPKIDGTATGDLGSGGQDKIIHN